MILSLLVLFLIVFGFSYILSRVIRKSSFEGRMLKRGYIKVEVMKLSGEVLKGFMTISQLRRFFNEEKKDRNINIITFKSKDNIIDVRDLNYVKRE